MVREVSNFITEREGSSHNDSDTAAKRVCVGKHCGRCGKVGVGTNLMV
jgi:hypothetical protein